MKVLHLLNSDTFSGAENVVCQIISICKNKDIDFVYCSPYGQIKNALDERNIQYNLLSKLCIPELKRVIKDEKPDIIHAHDMRASFFAALCCGKIPLISHIHNNAFDSRGLSLKSILYYFAGLKAKHIFWVSESSFNGYKFHNFLKNKSSVLYNVIKIDSLKNKVSLDKNDYNYDVIYLGRLTYPKNPQRLLRVLEKILDIRPKTKIAIIGTGDMDLEIKESVENNCKLRNVDFLGFKENPYKILSDSKIMIMTSRWEGTPMCVLEALSLGKPIVATPVDGLLHIIENDKNGYLSDDDDKIAGKICDLLENENQLSEMSKNASDYAVKLMNIEKYKNSILTEYKKWFKG